jgi:glycosyltransferase involved in cell wall biosynthesis
MTPDRVSLVIASYRRGAKIDPTLATAFAQTRVPDEILVLNDRGFPETRAYIAANFPTVRVVDETCGSAAAARNAGARHAANPLVMFLDDDDLLHPHAVETLLRTRRAFPEARAWYSDHRWVNQVTGEVIPDHHRTVPAFRRLAWARPVRQTAEGRLFDRRLYRPMLHGGLLQSPWMVEREAFLAIGGFDPAFTSNEDWELYLRMVFHYRVALTDEIISDHILEAGREHVSRSGNLEETSAAIIRKHLRWALRRADLRSAAVLLRRLGMAHKTRGDARLPDLRAAWREYLRAFRCWPFDHVVAARAIVVWPLRMLTGRPGGAA